MYQQSVFCLCHVLMTNILSRLRKVAMRELLTEHHHKMKQKWLFLCGLPLVIFVTQVWYPQWNADIPQVTGKFLSRNQVNRDYLHSAGDK